MYKILENICKANDIKKISPDMYKELAREIRACLIENVSKNGGHLASNLGVVELTIAIHLCLDFPKDKLVWDVGHQSYVHKILTGRWKELGTLRQYDGISGFPKMTESECDAFDTGHASTSISAALGYAFARQIQGTDNKVFAVIGDGSLTGGMAYEALNNANALKSNMVIILNDNNMSISKNVGGMSKYLTKLRTASQYKALKDNIEDALKKMPMIGESVIDKVKKSKSSLKHLMIPGMFFEDMGITYIGPVDGHNIQELVSTFNDAMRVNKPVLIHVKTVKGKGYKLAEDNPSFFHGVDPFNRRTGELLKKKEQGTRSYTEIFGNTVCNIAKDNDKVVCICAAMPLGTGLVEFAEEYRDRFFDVGIAEEHAVTFASALAAGGMVPVVAIYSTFLQRAYDQILHDVCESGQHVVFAVDRGGIVGNDGETHQGIFDISYLSSIPGLMVMAPKNGKELEDMLEYAINQYDGPVAIRYPRGSAYEGMEEYDNEIEAGKAEIIYKEEKVLMLALGSMVSAGKEVHDILKNDGIPSSLVNMRFAKPVDTGLIDEMLESHDIIVTMEENSISGGISQHIAAYMQWKGYTGKKCISAALPDKYIEHGAPELLKDIYGLKPDKIADKIRGLLE